VSVVGCWQVQVRIFCQNYSSHNTARVKFAVKSLEKDIQKMESTIFNNNEPEQTELLNKKKKELGSLLQQQVKGAIVRARICSIKDMDAPTSFFFNLEKKAPNKNNYIIFNGLMGL